MSRGSLRAAALAVLLGASACHGPRPMYRWGHYEPAVFELCTSPETVDVDAEVVRFEELIQNAQLEDRPVAPGMHAHLGYLYALQGNRDAAAAALQAEKLAYPESAVFVDGIVARMEGGQ